MPKQTKETRKELKTFKRANFIRNDLINALKQCDTAGGYQEIMRKYDEDQSDGRFSLKNINVSKRHLEELQRKDAQIVMLINDKRGDLKEKLIQLNERRQRIEYESESDSTEELIAEDELFGEQSESSEIIPESPVPTIDINNGFEKETVLTLNPETAILSSETAILNPETPILNPETPILNPETAILNPETAILNPETAILSPETEILSPETPILNPEFPVITREINPGRVRDLALVKIQLERFLDKKAEFIGKYTAHAEKYPNDEQKLEEFNKAIQATESIHDRVNNLYNEYIYGEIDLDLFKREAAPLLDDTEEDVQTLKSHRGLKEIVTNLLAAILSVGIIHAVAAIATGKFEFRLFKPATKSGVLVDNLDEAIENSHVAAASA